MHAKKPGGNVKALTPREAKRILRARGWTYRTAAPVVGRSYQWVCDVLNGRKVSRPVLQAVAALPNRKEDRA